MIKKMRQSILTLAFLGLINHVTYAQLYPENAPDQKHPAPSQALDPRQPYQDLSHESKVFGYQKPYRLYVPENYNASGKRYPVIYFFHGWGGRHFKDDNARLEYIMLKNLVNQYQVLMVMWDGNMDPKEPRPYNVGYHNDIQFDVQMKDYFPELMHHIDKTYRTLTDRNHRGLIGFSMGGFMSLYLSGKYPDQVCSAVSLTGSPEFFVGSPANHTLYPIRYTFKNLQDIDTRIHTSSTDILYYLNEEVYKGAVWEEKKLLFENLPGGHMVDKKGETVVFEKAMRFVTDSFQKKHKNPSVWSHYDLYPDFDLWGYHVESDKQQPGFLYLKNVSRKGFGIYSRKWLPAGPPVPVNRVAIQTAPAYKAGFVYDIVRYSLTGDTVFTEKLKSDQQGRLKLELNGEGHIIGIFESTSKPDWVVADYRNVTGSQFLKHNEVNKLNIKLLNRGGSANSNEIFKVKIRTRDTMVTIKDSIVSFRTDQRGRLVNIGPIQIVCAKPLPLHADPSEVKLQFIFPGTGSWDELNIPVQFDAPIFNDIKVDDGLIVRDKKTGTGNADGIVNPGEKVLIYQGENRLRLYTDDPYVLQKDETLADEIIPARWPDGYTQSSIIHISPDCPDGHLIECFASYETKTFNPISRNLHWGKVNLKVYK